MDAEPTPGLYPAPRSNVTQDQGSFRIRFNFPGRNVHGHDDHGYGPLATVVESFMDPDTLISMHPHRDEEIVSWVPAGVMRHDDRQGNDLVTDAEHVLAMNAGKEFWHAEYTRADDPPLRMLQIFVRPHELGLDPGIQHASLPDPIAGKWRHVFGPDGSDAPVTVRNAVDLYDVRLDEGGSVDRPAGEDRDVYFYVFEGAVTADGTRFDETESGLLVDDRDLVLTAERDAIVVAFLIDPEAPITRQGTIGR